MDNGSLIAAFKEASKSGWSLQSDVQVLKWLEDFTERLQKRANNVTEEMHKLLEQTEAVEQDLNNTFNSFRGLSNTQFIENRVCEGDEMTAENSDSSIQFLEVCVPAQRYEEDIVPRYKEALLSGWNGYKQYIQKSYRNTSEVIPHKVGWSNGQLPHIIGTEEFMRDNSCGLTEDRIFRMDPLELDGDAEGEDIHFSEMAGTRTLLEADWSGTESDKDDQVGMEPAVSAALDFKAMLEAALRSPYIPYDDILSSSKIISGYDDNIDIDPAASQVSAVSNSHPIIINQEISATPIHANITSESMGSTTHQVVSSSLSRKLYPDTVAGGLLDSEAGLSTSILNEYVRLQSQPVDSSHIAKGSSFNEKAKLKNSIHPEQINSSTEGKQDPYQSGSSYTSRKFKATEISEGVFENKLVSTSSRLQESTNALSLPTAQNSEHTNDTEKIKSIGNKREKGIATQEPAKGLFGSSDFSKQFHGALFSGGLFDDDEELVSSSPLESVHVWSQPSVPERLYGSNSDAKKNELSPSTSISSTAKRTNSSSSDKIITTDIHVSAESRPQSSGAEQLEETLGLNNEFAAGAPQFPKPNNGKQSPKERLSLLQKGLFDSGESDGDDDSSDPFRAASSIVQKVRLHDRACASDSNILQESSKVGVEFNIPNTNLIDFSEPHKVELLHSTDAFGRIEGSSTIGDYHPNISGVKNSGLEGRTSDSDDGKKFGTPVNLAVKSALDRKKGHFPSPVMPSRKEDPLHHFATAASTKDHSDYDSDSWSSSSSEKTIKSSVLDVKANTINNSKINSSSCENVVLEAKGISDPAGDSTSVLLEEGSVHSTQGGSLLEPTYGVAEYFSKKQEYSGKDDSSLPVSLAEFETLPADHLVDERVESMAMLNQSIEFLNTSILHENQSKDTERAEDKADVDAAHFHQVSSSPITGSDLEDSSLTFVSSSASLFKNEEFATTSAESVAIGAPQKTSGYWQADSLWRSNDQLQDSSRYALDELDDKTKDGQTVLVNSVQVSEGALHITKNIQKEPNSMSLSSLTPKDVETSILLSPSDKEAKSNLGNSSISSQPEGFPTTSVSSPLEETKVPSIYSQLFDDEDEEEANLFGALPKTNPVIASLLKTPGRRLSLFDSDEE